jgi:hypothetical protein
MNHGSNGRGFQPASLLAFERSPYRSSHTSSNRQLL